MESKIKWQTGEPKEVGDYLVALKNGRVNVDSFGVFGSKKFFVFKSDFILAWCKLNDIEPYKEAVMDKANKSVFDANAQCCDIMNHLIKEETMEKRQYEELRMPLDDNDKRAIEVTIEGNKITPPENYLIGKITKVDNGMIVEFVKKQPQYPKTYDECCKVLLLKPERAIYSVSGLEYKRNLIVNLQRLLICRDAYWKIAGEQMGLGEPWKPDWLNTEQDKFVLYTHDDVICLNRFVLGHNVLAFPTAEMRDAFLENFRESIEPCKELL